MKYGVVVVPAAPVRKKPQHKGEMVNQLLFGEVVTIVENKKGEWLKIKSLFDGYQGWVTHHMIHEIEKGDVLKGLPALTSAMLSKIEMNGMLMQVPMGSFLWGYANGKCHMGSLTYASKGKVLAAAQTVEERQSIILKIGKSWLNAPYLWGGKTILGVDCSGFSQTVFKMAGIPLFRDARDQATQGAKIKKLQDARLGDLAFFDDKDEIVHVGILLGPDTIIHAAGKVRIDTIDEKGITNVDTGVRTHQLKWIRRMAPLS